MTRPFTAVSINPAGMKDTCFTVPADRRADVTAA
jgi:hypothetical protein